MVFILFKLLNMIDNQCTLGHENNSLIYSEVKR
jgi:hypothetical protein